MCTQTCVIHILRTEKIPFVQSIASKPVLLITSLSAIISMGLPYTFIGTALDMHALPLQFYLFLGIILIAYISLASLVKKIYIKKQASLL